MSDGRREFNPERRKLAALAACVACMSSGPILLKGHPVLLGGWIAVMLVLVGYIGVQFSKLKGKGL